MNLRAVWQAVAMGRSGSPRVGILARARLLCHYCLAGEWRASHTRMRAGLPDRACDFRLLLHSGPETDKHRGTINVNRVQPLAGLGKLPYTIQLPPRQRPPARK